MKTGDSQAEPASSSLTKGSWQTLEFATKGDARGDLIALSANIEVPFSINRIYYMTNNRPDIIRGLHAHRNLEQLLIAVKGHVTVTVDDGHKKEKFRLDNHQKGLLIKNLVWREIFDFSDDCVLLVLASEHYNPLDYIHNYDLFLKAAHS